MSRSQDPPRPLFSIGNPFRTLKSKGSYLSPRLLELLNTFEGTLAKRLRNLEPTDKKEILSLSWMKCAVELLSATYTDLQVLITTLELPVSDWEEKWVDVYLDNSINLLDICLAFSSEISRLGQGNLYIHCFLHKVEDFSSKEFVRAQSSLDGWKKHIGSKNPRMEKCSVLLDSLIENVNLPKIKNSPKGKVLMRAMYGLRVATVFVCNVFAAALSGSTKKLLDLQLEETCLWSESFTDLQSFVNKEIRGSGTAPVLKELEELNKGVNDLCCTIISKEEMNVEEADAFEKSIIDFKNKANKLSQGLDDLAKEEDGFFQIVMKGRDALLSNLRVCSTKGSSPTKKGGLFMS